MKSPSAFELEVLEWVVHDYEAPHTIVGDIARELGRPVSDAEVRAALLELTSRGLVQAFVFEAADNRYRAVTLAEAQAAAEAWFMVAESRGA
jgi:hypothetical protein